MKRKSKRSFTLLEVMICICLLALCGSLFAVQGKKLWHRFQRQRSIDLLIDELTLTRHISQSLRADVTLDLKNTNDGILLVRRSDEPYLVQKKTSLLKPVTIKYLALHEPIHITFYRERFESNADEIRLVGSELSAIRLRPHIKYYAK